MRPRVLITGAFVSSGRRCAMAVDEKEEKLSVRAEARNKHKMFLTGSFFGHEFPRKHAASPARAMHRLPRALLRGWLRRAAHAAAAQHPAATRRKTSSSGAYAVCTAGTEGQQCQLVGCGLREAVSGREPPLKQKVFL